MIETCYFLVCSCGDRIRDAEGRLCTCDCPQRRRPKMPVVVRDGCAYCIQQAAVRAAALAVTEDLALRDALRAEDVTEEAERLFVAVPDDLPTPHMETAWLDSEAEIGSNLPKPTPTRRSLPR